MTEPDLLVLVCNAAPDRCRWRPPNDMQMALVEAHFDMEDGHDPNDIKMELVGWCHRCDLEIPLDYTRDLGQGTTQYVYTCKVCHRTRSVVQHPREAGG